MHLLSRLLYLAGIIGYALAQCPYMHRELFSAGSKSCVVGHAAVYGGDGQGSRHTTSEAGPITSGQIIKDGKFVLKLTSKGEKDVVLEDSVRIEKKGGEDDGSLKTFPKNLVVGKVYKIEVTIPKVKVKVMENGKEVEKEVERKFRGVQIVLSSTQTSFTVTKKNLYPEMGSTEYRQIDENCDKRAGVTHIERELKETGVMALLECPEKAIDDVRLDVNILVKTREWYYSQYILNCKAATPAPTKTPTKAPTEAPTEDPTGAPTMNPVTVPVRAPLTAPAKAPVVAPPAPVPSTPPVSFPVRSPMQPTWTASVSPSSPGNSPSGRVPISSPVASPTIGTPSSVSQFPTTTSTVPPSFEGDSSMDPTATVTTQSPVPSPPVVRAPSVILPTLFTPVAVVSCCSDTKINGGSQRNRQLRTICGPCPNLND
jgi:hypothetical protein